MDYSIVFRTLKYARLLRLRTVACRQSLDKKQHLHDIFEIYYLDKKQRLRSFAK